jgi:hypothetical protein
MRAAPRTRALHFTVTAISTTLAALGVALVGEAVTTRTIELDDAIEFAEGELQETTVSSLGEVRIGLETRKVPLNEVAAVWSLTELPGGDIALGTGNEGKIWRMHGETATVYAETGQLVVSALARGEGSDLYAGTVPGRKVYRVRGQGQIEDFAALPAEVEHVWALAWDPRRRVLFAGTGPAGVVYAIDSAGHPEPYFDSDETHILSLALVAGGALYAGTSPGALLLQVDGPGRARAVQDFPGVEVKAIALRDDVVYAAVNDFDSPPTPPSGTPTKAPPAPSAPTKSSPGAPVSTRPKPGKGSVWRVSANGTAERLLGNDDGHFLALALDAQGVAYAASATKGRIFTVDDDRVVRVLIDVEERQVMALAILGDRKVFATGDAGAFYSVGGTAPRTATYLSKVYDAQFISTWGRLAWRGEGTLVFQTRTGNTETTGPTWSDWSVAVDRAGRVTSPPARYVQFRARWERDPAAVVRAIELYYLNHNQRAIVTEVTVRNKALPAKVDDDAVSRASTSPPVRSTVYKVSWKVDNPDLDGMRYRLSFREEGSDVWRPITRPTEVLTKNEHEWETESVPAGYYRVRIEASDERSNPTAQVVRHEQLSPPVLIDNDPPVLAGVTVTGLRVSGRATDGFSTIGRLEYAVDGGEWQVVFPADDLLDAREESFAFELPPEHAEGLHVVTIRAFDEAGNQVTARAQVGARRR